MSDSKFQIPRLSSGGIITNYFCSSQCRHCLYRCSPRWEKQYITPDTAATILARLKELQVASFHVGGGEPLLNPAGLKDFLHCVRQSGLSVDYVETNSSWFSGLPEAVSLLEEIKGLGVSTLLVSISPFHNEFIPLYKVKGVIAACQQAGLHIFPWVEGFLADLDALTEDTPHPLSEYEDRFGKDYLSQILRRYWIHPGGRALKTFAPILANRSAAEIVQENPTCHELLDTSHFHIDLFGHYIPGLCSGLAINIDDIGNTLSEEKYPLLNLLFSQGVGGLLNLAREQFNFKDRGLYGGKCDLCFDIRNYLVRQKKLKSDELAPLEFYTTG